MRRWRLGFGLAALAMLVLLSIVAADEAAAGWRAAFLTGSAPILGAALMLAIARVTGADWHGFDALALLAPVIFVAAIALGVLQIAVPLPAHLAVWQHPIFVGVRAVLVAALIALAGTRLVRGASVTFAAVMLSVYAVIVTPLAFDWMVGGAPGHSVSAAGMMLFTEQFGGACAALLLLGLGREQLQRDIEKLLVAAALGLGYLTFMDFLIEWYGDLPSSIGWYVARSAPLLIAYAAAALGIGLFGTIAALTLARGTVRRPLAGGCALTGLLLFNIWWLGGGLIALIVALMALAVLVAACSLFGERRETAHG